MKVQTAPWDSLGLQAELSFLSGELHQNQVCIFKLGMRLSHTENFGGGQGLGMALASWAIPPPQLIPLGLLETA